MSSKAKNDGNKGQGRKDRDERDDDPSIQDLADHFLRREGLTFDFNAGREKYTYQVAIGDEGHDVLVGGRARDYHGASAVTTK